MRKQSMCVGASLFILSACAVGPDYNAPQLTLPSQFTNSDAQVFSANQVETTWWRQFNDAMLSNLVKQTLQHNNTLHIAQANLLQARALYMNSALNFLPQITSHTNFTEQKRSVGALNNRAFVPRELSLYNAGFDAFWELDVFGRVRRATQASHHDVEAITASLHEVSVSVIAEVARNYLELRALQQQAALLAQSIAHQEKIVALTQTQVNHGKGTQSDVQLRRAALENERAAMPDLHAAIAQTIHRLSVLTGQLPDALTISLQTPKALPRSPAHLLIGDPAALLKRRADIREAEHTLASATERIGVATADLFPRVTFIGSLSLESNTLKGLAAPGAESYSLGPKISWAFLDLARVYARIEAADALAQASLAQYHQTVLNALEETENALVNYRETRDKRALLARALDENQRAHALTERRYDVGTVDLLAVEESEWRVVQRQRELAQTDALLMNALIAVYKALGGGWENVPEQVN